MVALRLLRALRFILQGFLELLTALEQLQRGGQGEEDGFEVVDLPEAEEAVDAVGGPAEAAADIPAAPEPAVVLPAAVVRASWEERCEFAAYLGRRAKRIVLGQNPGILPAKPVGVPRPKYFVLVRNQSGRLYSPLRAYSRASDLAAEVDRSDPGELAVVRFEFASQHEVETFARAAGWTAAYSCFHK